MKVLDVNVLVNAFRPDVDDHDRAFDVLAVCRASAEPSVILTEVAVGFLRIVTHRGIFRDPNTSAEAMGALAAWTSGPGVRVREAGPGRWTRFATLVSDRALVGADVHDGLLAAAAIDLGATLVTFDRGFSRFDGLALQLL